ncbi:MAG TPA: aspartate/glutamate racemase family protein [Symbiobacteriaceae bacterium]|nr:aspartate/glutamate racemase family protein [Symbiobacteriaceae bacterium]
MKTIGLIGGMSWESSVEYYRLINQGIRERLGGLRSAKILLDSFDFEEIASRQRSGRWDEATEMLRASARRLEQSGAEFLLICTNTMHKVAGPVQDSVGIPLVHIADPTGAAIVAAGIKRIGLLGTAFTMEDGFYRQRLEERFGLEVLVPDEPTDRQMVHQVIFGELCQGVVREESRAAYRAVMSGLVARGAEGIILGCTEIGLLVGAEDASVPLFDTTRLHAAAAVEQALAE